MKSWAWRMRLDGRYVLAVFAALIAIFRTECSFQPGSLGWTPATVYGVLNRAPFVEKTKGELKTVFEETNGLKVQHGYSCAKANRGAKKVDGKLALGTRVHETVPIPAKYNATVFLNGWSLQYSSSDHHVTGLAATILNIAVEEGKISWDAGGALGDQNGDDPYEWCYNYTIASWPKALSPLRPGFDITVATSTVENPLIFLAGSSSTALQSIAGSHPASNKARGPLLNGFGTLWDEEDHHVLQVGFDLGAPAISSDTLLWNSSTILKDNSKKRGVIAAEIVSIIGGNSVKIWQPTNVVVKEPAATPKNELDLKPRSPSGCPSASLAHSLHVYEVTLKDLPFQYAIPMLNGWDLGDGCDDQHLKWIGASIRDFEMVRNPVKKTVTVNYTITGGFRDKDAIPNDFARFEVAVLGINRVSDIVVPPLDVKDVGDRVPTPVVPKCNGLPATIVGTAGDDNLTGTSGTDVIVGLAGNDNIKGGGGNDFLCGNEGNDKLDGGSGVDFCDGGLGTNQLLNCEP